MRAKHLKHLLLGVTAHSYLEQYVSPLFLYILIFEARIDGFPTKGCLVAIGLVTTCQFPAWPQEELHALCLVLFVCYHHARES